ncbi:MAG TPA: iron-containing redox enzyme family protein [Polyangiaceae bacterium]
MKQNRLETETTPANVRTMQEVELEIDRRRQKFATHPFLRALEGPGTLESFRRFAPRVAFFVMAFQDVLRLTHCLSSDPAIKEIARIHAGEDRGHEQWYLNDLERLGVQLDVRSLFSEHHDLTRDVAYGQISHVMRAAHDQTRLAVALSLEAIGSECFGRAIAFLDRVGSSAKLEYFARKHQAIEQGHQVFETDTQGQLAHIPVPEAAVVEVLEAIDNTFAGMTALMSDLESAFHG